MRLSLQAKVTLIVTLLIVLTGAVSTFIFTQMHRRSKERGLIIRGSTLNYSLSKATEQALVNENLDLIREASRIIRTSDVTLVQVYTSMWDAIDSYPSEDFGTPPHPDAIRHFSRYSEPFYIKTGDTYDFYGAIVFEASDDVRPVVIGFARNVLTSANIKRELRQIVVTNIAVSAAIALIAICVINILIRRLVIRPIMGLHKAVLSFKGGVMPGSPSSGPDEIGELSRQFYAMSLAIKDREMRLLESERRIKNLFERVQHAIFRLDPDGNIVEANGRFIELLGERKKFCSLFKAESGSEDYALRCLKQAKADNCVNSEETVLDAAGEGLNVLFSLYPEFEADGRVKGYDGYFVDITDRKRLEEQLRHSQKMEALGTLTGGVSHEFNNLLTAILGLSEMLQDEMAANHPFRRYVDTINAAALKGAALTKGLLAYSRKQISDMKMISLNKLIRKMEGFLSGLMGADIRLEMSLPDEEVLIMADANQMEQVFLNLAANSRDAMPEGGLFKISLDVMEMDEGFIKNRGFGKFGRYARLKFEDSGTGMDEQTRQKIFEPFFTTKEVGKGTGLGLSVVYGIIKKHHGYIEVASAPSLGTTFSIFIPFVHHTSPG